MVKGQEIIKECDRVQIPGLEWNFVMASMSAWISSYHLINDHHSLMQHLWAPYGKGSGAGSILLYLYGCGTSLRSWEICMKLAGFKLFSNGYCPSWKRELKVKKKKVSITFYFTHGRRLWFELLRVWKGHIMFPVVKKMVFKPLDHPGRKSTLYI